MPEFRKKPVVIEAMLYNSSDSVDEILAWMDRPDTSAVYAEGELYIHTLEGEMHASLGDWIIRGVQGEFYPCKPDIFADTYEAA
jgi:hypothetical protein